MTLLEKMKDFFNLSHVILEHSLAQKDVNKLNQVLTDMGADPINVSGLATSGLEVSIYKHSDKIQSKLNCGNMRIFILSAKRT